MSLITSIQKYSIHDGDGIRTTVFFKGCLLKCVWCHNPETQSYKKQPSYNKEQCVGCRSCEMACPHHAIRFENGKVVTDLTLCESCGTCTDHCNKNLREIVGKEYTVDALVKEAMKDKIFYEQSGGGVTLSGGEVMASQHMDYVEEVCRKLHENGVSVFIDTSGYTDYENLKRILPYVDVFLYDIKVMDPEDHKKYIGVDNSLILENLKKLSDEGAGLYIRLPIIQQVNATDEHIESVIHFLKENNIHARQVNLLPYHDIGKGKYASLDMEYHDDEMSVPVSELMEHFKSMFVEQGFNKVNIGG